MDGLYLPLIVVLLYSLIWAGIPFVTNTRTKTGNLFHSFPLALVFGSLAGISALSGMEIVWTLLLLLLAFAFVVYSAILRHQYRKFQFPDD